MNKRKYFSGLLIISTLALSSCRTPERSNQALFELPSDLRKYDLNKDGRLDSEELNYARKYNCK